MISKNRIKQINSLQIKKFRQENQTFVVESSKSISDLLKSNFEIVEIFATQNWIDKNNSLVKNQNITICDNQEIKKISALSTPTDVVAEVKMPKEDNLILKKDCFYVALDSIQDPGNLGTIIRACNWFGVEGLILSPNCVDKYNPKCIQASMGSIFKTKVYYQELKNVISNAKDNNILVYGTFLEGEDIYKADLPKGAIVVLGNEGHGISPELSKIINQKLYIPFFAPKGNQPESLNVSMATTIVCSEFKRRFF